MPSKFYINIAERLVTGRHDEEISPKLNRWRNSHPFALYEEAALKLRVLRHNLLQLLPTINTVAVSNRTDDRKLSIFVRLKQPRSNVRDDVDSLHPHQAAKGDKQPRIR